MQRARKNFKDLLHDTSRFIEFQSAYLGMAWGLVVFLPFADSFATDPVYRWLLRLIPDEKYWAMMVFVVAAFQGWAAHHNRLFWRRKATFMMAWVWAMISLNFLVGTYNAVINHGFAEMNVQLMALIGYPMFLIENLWDMIKLEIDHRRQRS